MDRIFPPLPERGDTHHFTQADADEMIAVITRDRLICGDLYRSPEQVDRLKQLGKPCTGPGHCAVGALLAAKGVEPRHMTYISSAPSEWEDDEIGWFWNAWGVTDTFATALVNANDHEHLKVIPGQGPVLIPEEEQEVDVQRVVDTIQRYVGSTFYRPDPRSEDDDEFPI